MSRSRTPTPEELGHWLAAAAVGAASGTYRYDGECAAGFGWFGAPPVFAHVPEGVEVSFWVRDAVRWRLQLGEALLAVTDGRRALALDDGEWVRARSLVAPLGPSGLLRPDPPGRLDPQDDRWQPGELAVDGSVQETEHAGRRAWRWTRPEETWVVDHETGVALLHEDDGCRRSLLTFEVHDGLPDDLFRLPEDLLAASRTTRTVLAPEFEAELGPERAAEVIADADAAVQRADAEADDDLGSADWDQDPASYPVAVPAASYDPREPVDGPSFVVPWWPRGGGGEVVSGDPSVPEVLLQLSAMDGPDVHLGVSRAGRPAPVRPGRSVHRWEGDGWSFALSYRAPVDPDVLLRVAASVPAGWDLS